LLTRRCLTFLTALALMALAIPSAASAQAWLSDRSRTEGPGFRLGDFELHPGIGVELGYDSNIYNTDDGATVPAEYRDSGILRATAHLLVSTRGAQRRTEGEAGGGEGAPASQPDVTFRGGLSGSFYHYFNDIDRTNMEIDASLALGILPGRVVSIDISENFGRSIRPFTEVIGLRGMVPGSYARLRNDAGVRFNFSTSGEVLKIAAGYNFALDYFEDQQFQFGNNFRHTLTLTETFRFLPETGIFHETQFVILDYFGGVGSGSTLVNDGFLLRSRLGVNGALTNELSFLVAAGYGAGFYNSAGPYDQDYESVTIQAEVRWQIAEAARLAFGYDRDFQPSFVGNWYQRDRGYANFQMLFERSFLIGVSASVGYYTFGAAIDPDGVMVGTTLNRSDIRVEAQLFAEYRFTDWLGVNGTLGYIGNFTDYVYLVEVPGGMAMDPAAFNKFEAWLGVRAFY
jgi:hypothetical protein